MGFLKNTPSKVGCDSTKLLVKLVSDGELEVVDYIGDVFTQRIGRLRELPDRTIMNR